MSNNGKKFLGGVIALVAIITLVNTTAIVELSKAMRGGAQSERVVYVPTQTAPMQEYYEYNQQAALGTLGTEVIEEDGGGIILYTISISSSCLMTWSAVNTETGATSSGEQQGISNGNGGCTFAENVGLSDNTNPITISLNASLGMSISSPSSTTALQFKLAILGYLSIDKISGHLDSDTQNAIKSLQKSNKITQTGSMGPLTTTALAKAMSSVKGMSGTIFSFSNQGSVKMGPLVGPRNIDKIPCTPMYDPNANGGNGAFVDPC